MHVLAELRERRRDDLLGDVLVGDAGHVIDLEAACPLGDEHVLAAQLQAGGRAGRAVGRVVDLLGAGDLAVQFLVEGRAPDPVDQLAVVPLDVQLVVVGIGVFLQVGAEHRLRFVPLRHPHRLDAVVEADPGVHADEVHEVGAQQHQLGHDGVVVIRLRHVAVAAALGLGGAHRVGEVRGEGLAGIADGGDRRLLDVDPVTVDVCRRQHQGRGRAHRRDHVALGGHMPAELEDVVPRDLRVVGGVVAGGVSLILVAGGLPVGLDRQVAAAAGGHPRGMAGETLHFAVLVGVVLSIDPRSPGERLSAGVQARHGLGAGGLGIEVRAARIDGILHQVHLPLEFRVDDRALDQHLAPVAFHPFEPALAVGIAQQGEVRAVRPRGGAGGAKRRIGVHRAVAVAAADLDRVGHLTHDQAAAVAVLGEVAVGALQALLGVDVHQVDSLAGVDARLGELRLSVAAPFLGIVVGDDIALGVQQIAVAVAFEGGAEIPAVAVVVGELGVLQLGC